MGHPRVSDCLCRETQTLCSDIRHLNVPYRHPKWLCREAENGRDAIEKAQQLRPDLIVLDMSMPVMNGLDAVRMLKRLMPKVPLIMYSGR